MTRKTEPRTRNLQGKEDKDLGPDPSVMLGRVDTEGLKGGQNHKNGGPAMPHGERQMHEQLIAIGLGGVVLDRKSVV